MDCECQGTFHWSVTALYPMKHQILVFLFFVFFCFLMYRKVVSDSAAHLAADKSEENDGGEAALSEEKCKTSHSSKQETDIFTL